MANILINGISSKAGGGNSVLLNFLKTIDKKELNHQFIVIVDSTKKNLKFINKNIKIQPIKILDKQIFIPFTINYVLPIIVKLKKIDLILNLATLIIPTKTKQIFFFQWPYGIYPDSQAWKLGTKLDRILNELKIFLLKKNFKYVDCTVAQGEALSKRISSLYNFEKVPIIKNSVSIENLDSDIFIDKNLGDGFKLLCLSYYYPHKNLEIFLELAEKIKIEKKDWKLIITIDKKQHYGAKKLLEEIKQRKLTEIIINIGSVSRREVPSLYKQTDALLLPTLLETFSGTYVEAMFHKKPILTSNLEFATDVCKDAALYFDPLDSEEIFSTINIIHS